MESFNACIKPYKDLIVLTLLGGLITNSIVIILFNSAGLVHSGNKKLILFFDFLIAIRNWSMKRIGFRFAKAVDMDANQLIKYAIFFGN